MVNKVFYQLDDKKWLFEKLQELTMTELAQELSESTGQPCSRGSIAWASKGFTPDEWKQIKFARVGKKIRKILEVVETTP